MSGLNSKSGSDRAPYYIILSAMDLAAALNPFTRDYSPIKGITGVGLFRQLRPWPTKGVKEQEDCLLKPMHYRNPLSAVPNTGVCS